MPSSREFTGLERNDAGYYRSRRGDMEGTLGQEKYSGKLLEGRLRMDENQRSLIYITAIL
jgi:hypothetical protein